jgi:hypothetical protein
VLNRIIRVTTDGWEYEADQRHAYLIITDLGLNEAKAVSTPSEEEKQWGREINEEKLESAKATRNRGTAARANYLAMNRPDIIYGVCRILDEVEANGAILDRKAKNSHEIPVARVR